ncbi:MAG TPA: hypothetical protein DDZ62_16575 [Delftia acidovorans]|nr:hypothetical protein [Delftia acidovorans]
MKKSDSPLSGFAASPSRFAGGTTPSPRGGSCSASLAFGRAGFEGSGLYASPWCTTDEIRACTTISVGCCTTMERAQRRTGLRGLARCLLGWLARVEAFSLPACAGAGHCS